VRILAAAMDRIQARYPALAFAGAQDGYFAAEAEAEVVEAIRASRADCLFIGMPTPLKERFLARYRDTLGVPFVMGVGGSFDVLAGHVHRAPRWAQTIGCEWAWRMFQEPHRLAPRYLKTNFAFARILAKALLQLRHSDHRRDEGEHDRPPQTEPSGKRFPVES
jgi:N-acetylglucosaminyldiphosphoundecaprenol N-acetyl-beta-D-mannosaminyltransferase